MRILIIFFIFCVLSFETYSQPDTSLWMPNNQVTSMAGINNTLFVGGWFDYVGPNTGCLVPVLESSQSVVNGFEIVTGLINRIIDDGQGGWFVAGIFHIENHPGIGNIAHFLPGYILDTNFIVTTNAEVIDIKLAGSKLYLGGVFTEVSGTHRLAAAAIDKSNGNLLPWDCNLDSNGVLSPIVYSIESFGSTVFLGGNFSMIGGSTRNNFAETDTITGLISGWNPNFNGIVKCIKVHLNDLYVSGWFTSVNSQSRKYLTRFSLPAHTLSTLSVNAGSSPAFIGNFDVVNNSIYIMGQFTDVSGNIRRGVAKVNLSGTLDLNWNPPSGFFGWEGRVVYNAGKIYATTPDGIEILDTITGSSLPSYIKMGGTMTDIAFRGDTVLIGSIASTIGTVNGPGLTRNYLYAINTVTGQVNGLNVLVNGPVTAMKMVNGRLIIAGFFNMVNGTNRNFLAAIDPVTGLLDTWNPSPNNSVDNIIVDKNLFYVCGRFDSIALMPQGGVSAFDTLSFAHVPSPVTISGSLQFVCNLTFKDSLMYIMGSFDTIMGYARRNIACLNLNTASITAFDANSHANAILYGGVFYNERLFTYGTFSSIGDSIRHQIAELDPLTGKSTAWNHDLNALQNGGTIYAAAVVDDSLLIGGNIITNYQMSSREPLILMDPLTGGFRNWNNLPTSQAYNSAVHPTLVTAYKITIRGNKLFAGGDFKNVGSHRISHLASYDIQPQPALNFKTLSGNVYKDQNHNCLRGSNEVGLENMILSLNHGAQYSGTDQNGDYYFFVNDTGTYAIQQVPRTPLVNIEQSCPALPNELYAYVDTLTTTIYDLNFGDSVNVNSCHYLTLKTSSMRRRLCAQSTTYAFVKNDGTGPSHNSELTLIYPSFITPISSIPPWTSKQDSLITFSLGTILPGEHIAITLLDSVSCNTSHIGLTACVNGEVKPVNNCIIPFAQYDGSDVELNAICQGSEVVVTIKNRGNGDMSDSSDIRVFYDSLFVYQNRFKLLIGDSIIVHIPASGQTIRLEADQTQYHPSIQIASVSVENCNGSGTPITGYVNQFNDDDDNAETDITCMTLLNGFDPNEKHAHPHGVTTQHFILPETEIEYTIHFQNTGNDVAYDVFIVDTLDPNLDLSTFHEGVASHPYTWTVSGSTKPIITFSFNSINLPDSGSNNSGSQGFIQFSIRPKNQAGPGTTIRNKAAIYFDLNPPVITNEWIHLIANALPADFSLGGGITITTGINALEKPHSRIKIFPNPSSGCFILTLDEGNSSEIYSVEVTDIFGTIIRSDAIRLDERKLCYPDLPAGIYYISIKKRNGISSASKLILLR